MTYHQIKGQYGVFLWTFVKSFTGPFLKSPEKFSHPKSHSKNSKLLITELFYLHTFNMNRGCLHTRRFRRVNLSAFRHKQWLCRPAMFLELSKTKPKCSRLPNNNKSRKTQWTKQKTGENRRILLSAGKRAYGVKSSCSWLVGKTTHSPWLVRLSSPLKNCLLKKYMNDWK